MIVPAANFSMYNSNSKCPQIPHMDGKLNYLTMCENQVVLYCMLSIAMCSYKDQSV